MLGSALPVLVIAVTVPLYLETIGASRYGALAIAWLLIGYFSQADFGIGRAVTRRLAALDGEDAQERAGIVTSALGTSLLVGIGGAIAVYTLGGLFVSDIFDINEELRDELLTALPLLALSTPFAALTGLASASLMGISRFRPAAIGNMIGNALIQILPLVTALIFDIHLVMLVWATLLARILHLCVLWPAVHSHILAGQEAVASRAEAARLLHFGKWVMVSALVGPLMVVLDRFAIGALIGAVAVAAYTIPFQIASRTMILPSALMQALFPEFSSQRDGANGGRPDHYIAVTACLFAPIAAGVICLAGPLLDLWLGDTLDARSIVVAQVVMAGFWINAVGAVPYTWLHARGEARFVALLHLAELPLYLVALVVLGNAYGLAGMAAAFALRCAVDAIVLLRRSSTLGKDASITIALAAFPVVAALLWSPSGWLGAAVAAILLIGASAAIASWRLASVMAPARP